MIGPTATPKYTDPRRFARFGVVGVAGTIIFYAVLWMLVELLRVSILSATSIAFLIVCLQNYALHYVWTFDSTAAHVIALPRFLAMNLTGFGMNWAIMYAGVEKMALDYLLTQAVALFVVVAWNFIVSSYWIFRASARANVQERGSAGRC